MGLYMLGTAIIMAQVVKSGLSPMTCHRANDPELSFEIFGAARAGAQLQERAHDMCTDEDQKLVIGVYMLQVPTFPAFFHGATQTDEALAYVLSLASHARMKAIIETYVHSTHNPLFLASPLNFNLSYCVSSVNDRVYATSALIFLLLYEQCSPGVVALLYHGDIHLARQWTEKMVAIAADCDYGAIEAGDFSKWTDWCLLYCGQLAFRRAGLSGLALSLTRLIKWDYHHSDVTNANFMPFWAMIGFHAEDNEYAYCSPVSGGDLIPVTKQQHWLLSPEGIDAAEFRAWLPAPEHANAGSSPPYAKVEGMAQHSFGCGAGVCGAEVFEALDPPEYDNAIIAAEAYLSKFGAISATVRVQANMVIGRSSAKLGLGAEAEAAFGTAIADAKKCGLAFLETLAIRDYIVHVLDDAGRRDEQLAALGGAIDRMALAPCEYTPVLDCEGLDAEAAVAAFRAAA
jgi:hypothetical protein